MTGQSSENAAQVLAEQRQQIAHEGAPYLPAWAALSPAEQAQAVREAERWLTAAERAGLITRPDPLIPAPQLTPEQVEELTAEFEAAWQRGNGRPTVLVSSNLVAQYRHLLGCIWLHVDWRWMTRQLATVQKELWADAVDAFGDPAETGPKAERWWREDHIQEGRQR